MDTKRKLYYKIGEVCRLMEIQPHVLRYWESEFSVLRPKKNSAGQRVYSERDLNLLRRIRQLLHNEGFTIAGARKRLQESSHLKPEPSPEPAPPPPVPPPPPPPPPPQRAALDPSRIAALAQRIQRLAERLRSWPIDTPPGE
ncbi:MAG: MerR family transcriptional regulator [Acidobacteria bacterium]|nr:MerR family transcriptional regulator [Acidobacteriota bacterium]